MRPATRCLIAAILLVVALGACRGTEDRRADSSPVVDSAAASQAAPARREATDWRVTVRGLGPLQAGMSIDEATRALGGALGLPSNATGCGYADWRGAPAGVRVMTDSGHIARVDVVSGDVATDAGARIGDSAARVRQLYGGRIAATPHKYVTGAQVLTVTPVAPADSAFRLVFETDSSGHVSRYRAGRRPHVEYVEGCG